MIKRLAYIFGGILLSSTIVLSQVGSIPAINWYYTAPTVNIPTTTTGVSGSVNNNFVQRLSIPNDIPSSISSTINVLGNKYNMSDPMQSALIQYVRSYLAILANPPRNQSEAVAMNSREVAANNCMNSRLPSSIMDDVTYKLEQSVLDSNLKRSSYEYYLSFMNENAANIISVSASCEDMYGVVANSDNSTTVNIPVSNNNVGVNILTTDSIPNGIVSDQDITTPCTVLTSFLSYGSKGTQVYNLQYFLVDNGYMEHAPTSYYGRNTQAAVLMWQKRHGIDQRGYVGPNTRASIASLTCGGNQSKVSAAYNGIYYASTPTTVKSVKAVTADTKTTVSKSVATSATNNIVILPTTTNSTTTYFAANYNAPTSTNFTNNALVSINGTFYTKRSPVNTLYFSYKAITSRDVIFYCVEKPSTSTCSGYESFNQVSERFEPGNIDMINNGDRWLFNIYYNNNWSNGGKIYFRNGINNISEVYTVKVIDSL